MIDDPTAPADWYQIDGQMRYWDGSSWSQAAPMSPTYCRGCGRSLDPRAVTCPMCGVPQSVLPTTAPGRKDPGLAVLFSFLWSGAGQLYVGEEATNRGIALVVVTLLLAFFYMTLIGLVLLVFGIPLWIWAMVDANNSAKRYNAQHGFA